MGSLQLTNPSLRTPPRPHVLRCLATPFLKRPPSVFQAQHKLHLSSSGKVPRRVQLQSRAQQASNIPHDPDSSSPASAAAGPQQAGSTHSGPDESPPNTDSSSSSSAEGELPPGLPSEEELWEELQQRLKAAGLPGLGEEEEKAAAAEAGITPDAAIAAISMGSWRLKEKVCPQIEALASRVENAWREILEDLALYPLPKEFRYMDSLDPEGKTPFAYQELKDPEKGTEGWPRLQIENRCYQSRVFRKLHLEVAVRQDGLQVLHCVMYPRLEFDLPILSMDLVAKDNRVSLAIIDPCPVSRNLTLPPLYLQSVRELQARFSLQNNRSVPDWGKAIFSTECVLMRPTDGQQIAEFLKYAIALSEVHVQLGRLANPVASRRSARLQELHAAHKRYCEKQLENDKTRSVLASAFGADVANTYMQTVMFSYEELPAGAAS